ncbi:TetR/AcrR family transcriptional regulator [Pseudonocardia parietis]|uniref:TetR/AcrR family transcriptional regulator n=1 Tax=Pseudonocardia parietis TaxID=570936 RepID=UPI001FD8A2D8|nr:TetR/AcrR family transcriptional regulator [Pseudonocardia parietis]
MPATEPPRAAAESVATVGRRDRKKRATRAAVLDAVLQVVAEQGVEKVTIDQIAAQADIAQRTFFHHFPTKEEALVATMADNAEALLAAFRARPPGESVLQALYGAVVTVFDGVKATDPVRAKALRAIRDAPSLMPFRLAFIVRHEHDMAEAISERLTDSGVDESDPLYPEICAAAAYSALRVILTRWLAAEAGPESPTPTALLHDFERALTLIADGLDRPAAVPGRSRI